MAVDDWGCGGRHIQLLLLITCGLVELSMQLTMRVSINLVESDSNSNFTLFDDPFRKTVKSWNDSQKTILSNSWLVFGYLSNFIGGWLTLRVNLKWYLLGLIGTLTILVYLMPHAIVHGNFDIVLVTIFVMGFIHGMKETTIVALLALWTPSPELGRSVSIVFSVPEMSFTCLILLYNFLHDAPAAWASLFYLLGNVGVLWCVAWYTFGCHSPDKCFFVSPKERSYIHKHMYITKTKKPTIPWKEFVKKRAFYGTLLSISSFQWFHTIFCRTNLTQLFARQRGFRYQFTLFLCVSFVLASIPVLQLFVGMIVETIIDKMKYPTRYLRKTLNSVAFWGGSISLVLTCYDTPLVADIIFLCCFAVVSSLFYQGALLSFFDVDRKMSGFMYGLVNFIALIPVAFVNSMIEKASIASQVKTYNLDDYYDEIWISAAAMLYFGNFFYIILGTDENDPMIPKIEL